MITTEARNQSRLSRIGWGILLFLTAVLALQGIGIYFTSVNPAFLDRFLNTSMSEVRQSYPTVAAHVVNQGENFGILATGFGLLALVVALKGFRHGSRWAWNAFWVVVGALAVMAVKITVQSGTLDISLMYAALALARQLLAGRELDLKTNKSL